MSCIKISKTNKGESSLFNTLYNKVADQNEQLATFYYNWFHSKQFKNLFGFDYIDYYNKGIVNDRLDSTGEPMLFYDESVKKYYFKDKNNSNVYFPFVHKGLSNTFTGEQIKNITSRLTASYISRHLGLNFNNIDLSKIQSSPKVEDFIVKEINKRIEFFNNQDDKYTQSLMMEVLKDNVPELTDLVIKKFKSLAIDVDEDSNKYTEEESTREELIGKPSFARSSKSKVSTNVKFRLSLLKNKDIKDDIWEDDTLMDFNTVYSKLQNILCNNIPLSNEFLYDIYVNKIGEYKKIFPYLEDLHQMLVNNKDENFRYEFTQAFFLAKNTFLNESYNNSEEGIVQNTIDLSNSHDKIISVKDRFINNFKISYFNDNLLKDEFKPFIKNLINDLKSKINFNSTLNNASKIKDIEAYKDFLFKNLNTLGLNISKTGFDYFLDYPVDGNLSKLEDIEKLEIYNKINNLASQLNNYFFKYLNNNLNSEIDINELFKTTDAINKLIRAQAFVENDMSDPNIRIGGEKRWIFSNPSHLHMELERWKKDPSILLKDYENITYLKDSSRWIKQWFELDKEMSYEERIEVGRKNLQKVKLGILGEITYNKGESSSIVKTTDLSYKDYFINNINSVLKESGFVRTITQADKATEFTMKSLVKRFKSFVGYNKENLHYELSQEVKDTFYNYYLSELKRSLEAKNTVLEAIKNNDYSKLIPHYHYNYKEFLKNPESIKNFTGNAFKSQYFDKLNPGKNRTNLEQKIINIIYDKNGQLKINDLSDFTLNKLTLKEDFENYFQQMISSELGKNVKELLNLGIIQLTDGKYNNKLIDSQLFDSYITQQTPIGRQNAIIKLILDYTVNGISNNIEFAKLFTGDIAYYKDSVDFKKRIPATYTDGKYLVLKPGEEKFKIATINAVIKNNPYLNELIKNGIDEHTIDMLTDINDTDAQAWITPERWRFLKKHLGEWTPAHDKVYQKMQSSKNEEFDKDELKIVAQPLKGVYFYKINGHPTYLKYSQAVLTKSLVKGTDLERMLNKMYASEIDELITFDGVKVGPITPTQIHDENGNLLSDDQIKFNVQELNNHGWKLQQDLPTKLFKDTDVGSQIQKNIFAGLRHFSENTNFIYKGKKVSGKEIEDELVKTVGNLSDNGFKNLIRKAGINEDGKITNVSKFYKALIDELSTRGGSENVIEALKSETDLFGIPQTTGKLFQIFASMINKNLIKIQTNGGSFIQMANFGLSKSDIENNNTGIILNPNIDGLNPPMLNINEDGSKSVTPGSVFVPASFIAKYIPDWKKYTPEELFVGVNGNPPIIDKRIQENIIGYRIPNQGLPSNDALQIAGILPESAGDTIVAYTGMTKKTGSDFDIDKMYIMFPHYEKVIDKSQDVFNQIETVLKGNTNEETFNNYKSFLSKFDDIDNEILNQKFIETYNSFETKEDKTNYLRQVRSELIDFILLNINSKPVKITFKNIEFKVKGLKYSTKGVYGEQNKLIEIYKSVLTNPEVYSDVMKSIDNDLIKNDINDLKPDVSDSFMSVVNPRDDIEKRYSFLGGKAGVGMEANAMTDIWRAGTLFITNLANFTWGNYNRQTKEIELDKQYSEELSEEDLNYYAKELLKPDSPKERVDAFKNEIKKIKIGETLGTILNAFVDIAKEPYITNGNWTTSTTNVGNLMLRMGVHPLYVTAFLANPIIAKYNRFQQNNEGLFDNMSGDIFNKFKSSIIEDYIGKENPKYTTLYKLYFKNLNYSQDYLNENPDKLLLFNNTKKSVLQALNNDENEFNNFLDLSKKYYDQVFNPKPLNLFDRTTNQYNNKPLNLKTFRDSIKNDKDVDLNFQITLLNEFRNIQQSSKNLKHIVDFGKLDTNGIGKDPNTIFYLENLLKEIYENSTKLVDENDKPIKGVIRGFESKLDNTVLSKYYNNLLKIKEILLNNPSFFPMSHNSVRDIITTITNDVTKDYSKKEETYIKISNQFKTYIYNKIFDIDNASKQKLIKNMPNYFLKFQKENKGSYFMIDNLSIRDNKLELNNSKKSEEFQNLFTQSWRELFEDHPQFAESLVKYSFINSGFNMTRTQFYSYIPFDYFIKLNINKKLKNIFNEANFDEFINKFYLNHLDDTSVVKNVLKDNVEQDNDNNHIIYSKNNRGSFITIEGKYFTLVGSKDDLFTYVEIKNKPVKNDYNVELEMYEFDLDNLNTVEEIQPEVQEIKNVKNSIVFEEEKTEGYKARTIKNASADITIAIAKDFNTAGEKLTKNSVLNQGKIYLPVSIDSFSSTNEINIVSGMIAQQINNFSKNNIVLNIAGNGIYSLKNITTQNFIDNSVLELLEKTIEKLNPEKKIISLRTGGQTGIDEAGAKAGIKLGIPTKILAPKGWVFRNIDNIDISDEKQFKERFSEFNKPQQLSLFDNQELWNQVENEWLTSGRTKEDFDNMTEEERQHVIKNCL